jgi:hypothetical protein
MGDGEWEGLVPERIGEGGYQDVGVAFDEVRLLML